MAFRRDTAMIAKTLGDADSPGKAYLISLTRRRGS
jgi:hypothetical protein